jgi:hypothetical protein
VILSPKGVRLVALHVSSCGRSDKRQAFSVVALPSTSSRLAVLFFLLPEDLHVF